MVAKDIMTRELVTVKPDASIREIAETLVNHKFSGLPVVDEKGHIIGIVSEGDLMQHELAPEAPEVFTQLGAVIYGKGLKEYRESFRKVAAMTAREIMTQDVITMQQDEDVSRVGQIMLKHHIKRVPILDGERLVGIISRQDIVKMMLEN